MKLIELPTDIIDNIFAFVSRPKILKTNIINKLLSDLNNEQLNDFWIGLNTNINAIDLFKKYPNKICWLRLVNNKNSLDIIEKNLNYMISKLSWEYLSKNPGLINIIEKNLNSIDWYWVSTNKSAIKLLLNNLDKINWIGLSFNPNAISILEDNLDKVDIGSIVYNKNIFNSNKIIKYLEDNITNINLEPLCKNININKSEKILNIFKNILEPIYFMIISEPSIAFNSDLVYNHLLTNYNNIDWSIIFNYIEFFKSDKMINLLEYIFNLISIDTIKSNLWTELLTNSYSFDIPKLTNIIIKYKTNINYYFLGTNNNIFTNNI